MLVFFKISKRNTFKLYILFSNTLFTHNLTPPVVFASRHIHLLRERHVFAFVCMFSLEYPKWLLFDATDILCGIGLRLLSDKPLPIHYLTYYPPPSPIIVSVTWEKIAITSITIVRNHAILHRLH
jgi:hypothetical protein